MPFSSVSVHPGNSKGVHLIARGLPALLVGGPFPHRSQPDWRGLAAVGVRHVVCLASKTPELRYDLHHTGLTWLVKENVSGPIDLAAAIEQGKCLETLRRLKPEEREDLEMAQAELAHLSDLARQAWLRIEHGEGVFVHCEYGIERTGLFCALVLLHATEWTTDKVARQVAVALNQASKVTALEKAWDLLLAESISVSEVFRRIAINLPAKDHKTPKDQNAKTRKNS